MKRYYLYNALMTFLAGLMFLFFRYSGFFISLIMRQDIIYFVVILPVYLGIGIFGIAYQLFKYKDSKVNQPIKIMSMLTTLYLIFILCLQTRIYNTVGNGLLIVLMAIPIGTTLAGMTLINLKKLPWRQAKTK